MDYNKVELLGRLVVQIVDSLSAYSSADEGRLIYDNTNHLVYYGNQTTNGFKSLIDIPRDSKILVESDTAVVGYSLLGDQDDDVVYITRGSAAGGEIGGSSKLVGTFTQSNHSHGMTHYHGGENHLHSLNNHIHTVGIHTHQFIYYAGAGYTYSYDANGNYIRVQDYGTQHTTGLLVNVTDGDPRSTATSMYLEAYPAQSTSAAGGTTSYPGAYNYSTYSASTTASGPGTWRPSGRNFTRQQRV